ncbi:MAG TPA: NAD(P)/FAD-dependent oxidoreductase [Burkholderiaceae bacterium]|nr:NAD(P)/FAD-dependent oxidoreductase [Burkholderiaceae bacterium]
MKTKTVAVIGAGVAGLAAGIHLAQRGLEVTVYERAERAGGCCTTTELDGYQFADGAMYLAIPGILDVGFARLGMDRAALLPLRQIERLQTSTFADGSAITFGVGGALAAQGPGLDGRADALRAELAHLTARWRELYDVLTGEIIVRPLSVPRLLAATWRHLPKLAGTVGKELGRHIADPKLRAALANVTLYTGLAPERTPAFQMVGTMAMLLDQFYLPVAGMGAIPAVLEQRLLALGGKLVCSAQVKSIAVAHGRATALNVEGRGAVPYDAIVSTVSGMHTFASLLDPADVPAAMRRKTQRAPLSQRAVSVQFGLRNRIDGVSHFNYRTPLMEQQHRFLDAGDMACLAYSVPTVTAPELARGGGSIIEVYPSIDQSLAPDAWTDARAEQVAQAAQQALAALHPLDVAVRRVRSPRYFRDRMFLYEGAVYGLSPAADNRAQYPHATPIPGLYQAGQTSYPGFGVSTSLLSGIFAAEQLLARA